MSRAEKSRRLRRADELARGQATQWRVFYKRSTGIGVRNLVNASTESAAVKKVRGGYRARPILKSSEWRAIYQEVGIPTT